MLSGCTAACYPHDGEPLNPDGPHYEALPYRGYDASTFKRLHATEGWWNAAELAVTADRLELTPAGDPLDRPDPALWATTQRDQPIRELPVGTAHGCPVIFRGGFQATKRAAISIAATTQIWGAATARAGTAPP